MGPAFNLLKGTCRSRVELEYHFKECYKAVTDRLDWMNPEGHEYLFDLSKPLTLIEDQGHQVVPANYFINNDLEYIKEEALESGKRCPLQLEYGIVDVYQTVLHDIASILEMDYLPKRRWSKFNRKRSHIIIKAIGQQLFKRRLMRNLEKFVAEREYGEDFRLLERTI
ncbi:hypothetical protein Tco_0992159 [Tanacetum coccineum]|uniref:Uncharacterized protein n=1 Tax=Tanacetum coccineum TaxID=301880 RepID=A0ABQ5F2M8_9ASTR